MDKEKLRNHLRTHTKEKPYHCPLCNYQAARRDYMKKHLNSLHKDRSIEQIEAEFPKMFNPSTTIPVVVVGRVANKDVVSPGILGRAVHTTK